MNECKDNLEKSLLIKINKHVGSDHSAATKFARDKAEDELDCL